MCTSRKPPPRAGAGAPPQWPGGPPPGMGDRGCVRAGTHRRGRGPSPRRIGGRGPGWRIGRVAAMGDFEWQFALVLLTNGIMIGLMYALIALGFVLIYKATDAIN